MGKIRTVLALLLATLPSSLRRLIATHVLGWEIHPTAHLGRSLIVVDKVTLGPGARVGTGNVIRGLAELRLGTDAYITSLNWVSGPPVGAKVFPKSPNRWPALILHHGATITSRHIIDCSDTVTLETFAILSGIRSTVFTHSVDLVRNQQRTSPVLICERSAVLTNSLLLAGTVVAPRSIISAGSVVNTVLTEEHAFYRGNPAEKVRDLPPTLGLFTRTEPHIE